MAGEKNLGRTEGTLWFGIHGADGTYRLSILFNANNDRTDGETLTFETVLGLPKGAHAEWISVELYPNSDFADFTICFGRNHFAADSPEARFIRGLIGDRLADKAFEELGAAQTVRLSVDEVRMIRRHLSRYAKEQIYSSC